MPRCTEVYDFCCESGDSDIRLSPFSSRRFFLVFIEHLQGAGSGIGAAGEYGNIPTIVEMGYMLYTLT